jgi:single-strand DNA-binding protein
MRGVNKVTILGHLGKDPESRFMPNGKAVCNFSIATSEQWKDKQTGEKKEATEWHNIAIYDRLAEVAAEYLRKGSPVYVEGKLHTRKWEKDGVTRYTTEIIVNEMRLLGDRPQGGQQQRPAQQTAAPRAQGTAAGRAPRQGDGFDDDIPF